MSEISKRYARLADSFAAKIAAVPDDKWSSRSPCEEWTARDVVAHVIGTQGMFLGFVGRELGETPSVDLDPLGAWTAARTVVQAELDDPERAAVEFQGFSGATTFEAAVDKFLCTDLVMHGWDLAHAAGLDDRIEPEDIERVRRYMEPMGDALRGPQAFGPAVDARPDAGEQEKLLAFLGRRP
jgi:uncharacterized protein (TIGR03086 family)